MPFAGAKLTAASSFITTIKKNGRQAVSQTSSNAARCLEVIEEK